jgi:uncharacterized protein involved in exopolysaccharide biosynthesis
MTENTKMQELPPGYMEEDEINLLDYWRVIWKRRKMIIRLAVVIPVLTAIISLFMTNIYQAKTIIAPISPKEGATGGLTSMLAQQFGGLPGMILPGAASASEIVNLLNSNVLREKIITRYNLLPVLFPDDWDAEKNRWKKEDGWGISLNPRVWISALARMVSPPPPGLAKKTPGVPDVWDGLRELDDLVSVKNNIKDNSITITAEFRDPEMAAKLADYFLTSLTDHMSAEARRVADVNRKYLESQLDATADPFIKQKIYNLIAQQIETSMMAEVKENFAFKVLDPPKPPDKKIKPKRAVIVILSFVMALFIGVFVAFFLEYLEKQNIIIKSMPWPFRRTRR